MSVIIHGILYIIFGFKYSAEPDSEFAHSDCAASIIVYIQIFEAHNFRGLLFPNILQKQFSWIKNFEYTIFQNFASILKLCAWKIWMYTVVLCKHKQKLSEQK